MKTHWPLIGMLVSAGLFVAAASVYPGGTTASANTVGYDWTRNFISSLFHATALNGAPNRSRSFAIPAMLVLCVSVGFVFKTISMKATSGLYRRTIEIAGIASMVYAFLVVTPMHNLMVTIALAFFVIAMLATLRVVHIAGQNGLLIAGVLCFVLQLVTAVVYYGNVLYALLPILQKASFIACAGWLFVVYYSRLPGAADASAAPNQSMEQA